jgi:hypothetical protein
MGDGTTGGVAGVFGCRLSGCSVRCFTRLRSRCRTPQCNPGGEAAVWRLDIGIVRGAPCDNLAAGYSRVKFHRSCLPRRRPRQHRPARFSPLLVRFSTSSLTSTTSTEHSFSSREHSFSSRKHSFSSRKHSFLISGAFILVSGAFISRLASICSRLASIHFASREHSFSSREHSFRVSRAFVLVSRAFVLVSRAFIPRLAGVRSRLASVRATTSGTSNPDRLSTAPRVRASSRGYGSYTASPACRPGTHVRVALAMTQSSVVSPRSASARASSATLSRRPSDTSRSSSRSHTCQSRSMTSRSIDSTLVIAVRAPTSTPAPPSSHSSPLRPASRADQRGSSSSDRHPSLIALRYGPRREAVGPSSNRRR